MVLGESREREGGQTPPAEEGEGADTQNILENTDKGREGKEGKKEGSIGGQAPRFGKTGRLHSLVLRRTRKVGEGGTDAPVRTREMPHRRAILSLY